MLSDIINWVVDTLHNVVHWFQTVAPGGFGLILIPLIILGIITILVARRA
jgi:hypothetical protein